MRPRTPYIVNVTIAVCLIAGAFYMFLQSFDFITSPVFLATISVSIVLLLINNSLSALIDAERFKQLSPEEKKEYLELVKTPYLTRVWRSAFKKTKEEELGEVEVLDHGYDGIQELDNQLPKWYIGLFAVTIVYAIVYFFAYSFTDFAHQEVEYDQEYKAQLAAIAIYEEFAPQATLETAEYNPNAIEDGKVIYDQICKTCHGEGAKGLSGPNQTDDFWINIFEEDEFKNIFYTIWNGSQNDLTMRAFGATGELTGNDIVKVSSYLLWLNQNTQKNPDGSSDGKAPQGTLAPWAKGGSGAAAVPAANTQTESTETAESTTDSTAVSQ